MTHLLRPVFRTRLCRRAGRHCAPSRRSQPGRRCRPKSALRARAVISDPAYVAGQVGVADRIGAADPSQRYGPKSALRARAGIAHQADVAARSQDVEQNDNAQTPAATNDAMPMRMKLEFRFARSPTIPATTGPSTIPTP